MQQTLTVTLTLNIDSPLTYTGGAPPGGTVGVAYSFQLTAAGGVGPYAWSATGLPSGLALSAGGLLSGTPTAAGNFNMSVSVSDTGN